MTDIIRRCRRDDLGAVTAFIHEQWSANHILSWHRPLMDFQHGHPGDPEHYNWLIAERDGRLSGILGYIPTRLYDPALADRNVCWLSIWKVREKATAGLGLRLLGALAAAEPNVAWGVSGFNPAHPPLYRAFGCEVGVLSHHALFAPGARPRLAVFPEGWRPPPPGPGAAVLARVDASDIAAVCAELRIGGRAAMLPAKTPRYFENRYLRHPVYQYEIHVIFDGGRPEGLMASRIAEHQGARALRIVDFLGESKLLSGCGPAIADLTTGHDAEYADILQFGLDDADLDKAGFTKIRQDGGPSVPNYFEPFVPAPRIIPFALRRAPGRRYVLFRGDSDQDRPSIIGRGTRE